MCIYTDDIWTELELIFWPQLNHTTTDTEKKAEPNRAWEPTEHGAVELGFKNLRLLGLKNLKTSKIQTLQFLCNLIKLYACSLIR